MLTQTPLEQWRAETMFTKEPGTVKWVIEQATLGGVFYDVGANVGQYTLIAAQRGARVVAFEPHLFNASSLARNVLKNEFTNVQLITSPLYDVACFLPFNYLSTQAGSSGSQLGHTRSERGEEFTPAFIELKNATTIDELVGRYVISPPNFVKIDVDGNEMYVLKGMKKTLKSRCIRSMQIEMHPQTGSDIASFLTRYGYAEVSRHHTTFGQAEIDKGADPSNVFYNAIYEQGAAA